MSAAKVFVPVALAKAYLRRRWNRLEDEIDTLPVFSPAYHDAVDEIEEIEEILNEGNA